MGAWGGGGGGALAPPLFEQQFMYYYIELLNLDEILVVFTVIIVG